MEQVNLHMTKSPTHQLSRDHAHPFPNSMLKDKEETERIIMNMMATVTFTTTLKKQVLKRLGTTPLSVRLPCITEAKEKARARELQLHHQRVTQPNSLFLLHTRRSLQPIPRPRFRRIIRRILQRPTRLILQRPPQRDNRPLHPLDTPH